MPTLVLYTLNPWTNALPMLRVTGPAQALGWRALPGNRMETVSPHMVALADLVVIQRDFPRLTAACAHVFDLARARGIPVLFDLDDHLFALPETHPDRQSGFYDEALLPMARAMLDADALTVSTAPLAEYARQFNPHTFVLPNLLLDQVWPLRPPAAPHAGPVIVGFAGGPSHAPDLAAIAPALESLLARYGSGLALHFWGLEPPPALRGLPQVGHTPLYLYEYAAYASYLAAQPCDIFLAPLLDTPFNRAKSAVKFLEYAALGVPGVYSRLPPYETAVEHGQTGFLAASLAEWGEHLAALIDSGELRAQTARTAQQALRERWLVSREARQWAACYENFLTPKGKARDPRKDPRPRLAPLWLRARARFLPPGSRRAALAALPEKLAGILAAESLAGLARRVGQRVSPPGPRQPFRSARPPLPTAPRAFHKASIVILTHNNANYTRLCLESLFAHPRPPACEATIVDNAPTNHTRTPACEVILVDNASTDHTRAVLAEYAARHPEIRLILNETNQGFARGNNQALEAASGDLLVFLNNDTVLTEGWLTRLAAHLANPRVGMAGPVTNSSGNESCIPVSYHSLEEMHAFAAAYAQEHAGESAESEMLAFLCAALPREVIERVGPLDEQFGTGMFEDDDYAMRVRQAGWQIRCAEDVFIHHWGSASFSRVQKRRFHRLHAENRRKFERKWGVKWQWPRVRGK